METKSDPDNLTNLINCESKISRASQEAKKHEEVGIKKES